MFFKLLTNNHLYIGTCPRFQEKIQDWMQGFDKKIQGSMEGFFDEMIQGPMQRFFDKKIQGSMQGFDKI